MEPVLAIIIAFSKFVNIDHKIISRMISKIGIKNAFKLIKK